MEYKSELRYRFWQFSGFDRCSECQSNVAENVCQHCGDIICLHDDCSINFPYMNDEIYSVCTTCIEIISNKLKKWKSLRKQETECPLLLIGII